MGKHVAAQRDNVLHYTIKCENPGPEKSGAGIFYANEYVEITAFSCSHLLGFSCPDHGVVSRPAQRPPWNVQSSIDSHPSTFLRSSPAP
jgi:hypothetical protein